MPPIRTRAALGLAALAAASGCDEPARAIDPYPLRFDLSAGPVMVGALTSSGESTEPIPVVIDTLSPVTVIDSFVLGEPVPAQARRRVELTLLGLDDLGMPTVPRVRFPDTAAFDVHPCQTGVIESECQVGIDLLTVPVRGIVGADVLGRSAVRFDFGSSTMRFFPDAAGSDAARGRNCEAVFPTPFAGGGIVVIAGSEISYPARRPAVGICLSPPDAIGSGAEGDYLGVDVLLVMSTGVGISLLSVSAYDRYAGAVAGTPARADLPPATVHLPSGPIVARVADIPLLALVGEESEFRGPCLELFASKVMIEGGCAAAGVTDCPCEDEGDDFCRTGTAVELSQITRFAVVSDTDPLLQALRDELRPGLPEVDGILGVDAMRTLSVELDYPRAGEDGRMLVNCLDDATCLARPQIRRSSDIDEARECL